MEQWSVEIEKQLDNISVNETDGDFGSYGKQNLITFQSKVDRGLYRRYEVIRNLLGLTRRQSLENFFRWSVSQLKDRGNLDEYFRNVQ